jgi:hypothetical protein
MHRGCPEWPDQSVLFRSLAPQPHLSLIELLESVGKKEKDIDIL